MTTRTVGELIQDLRERADVEGMTVRHEDESLRRNLTQSFRSLRAVLTRGGTDVFIEGTTPASLAVTAPVTGEQYLEVDWPTGAVSIHGVDVLFGGERWYELRPISFGARRSYQTAGGPPAAFCVRKVPTTTPGSSLDVGKILVVPLDTTGYQVRVWYLPEFPTLENDTHVVQGFEGDWVEWALWDSVIKIAARDDDAQNVDQIALRERAMLQERITTNINRVQRAGTIKPRRRYSRRR